MQLYHVAFSLILIKAVCSPKGCVIARSATLTGTELALTYINPIGNSILIGHPKLVE
jgi:hypothetical protein